MIYILILYSADTTKGEQPGAITCLAQHTDTLIYTLWSWSIGKNFITTHYDM